MCCCFFRFVDFGFLFILVRQALNKLCIISYLSHISNCFCIQQSCQFVQGKLVHVCSGFACLTCPKVRIPLFFLVLFLNILISLSCKCKGNKNLHMSMSPERWLVLVFIKISVNICFVIKKRKHKSAPGTYTNFFPFRNLI